MKKTQYPWKIIDKGKTVTEHKTYHRAQVAAEKLYKQGLIGYDYKLKYHIEQLIIDDNDDMPPYDNVCAF